MLYLIQHLILVLSLIFLSNTVLRLILGSRYYAASFHFTTSLDLTGCYFLHFVDAVQLKTQ